MRSVLKSLDVVDEFPRNRCTSEPGKQLRKKHVFRMRRSEYLDIFFDKQTSEKNIGGICRCPFMSEMYARVVYEKNLRPKMAPKMSK